MQESKGKCEQSQLLPAQHPAIQPVRETPETNILKITFVVDSCVQALNISSSDVSDLYLVPLYS